jgi:hypothetical protein
LQCTSHSTPPRRFIMAAAQVVVIGGTVLDIQV